MKTQITNSKPGFLGRLGWVVMTFLALLFLIASRYLTLDPDVFFTEQKLVYMTHTAMIVLHVAGAMLAILIGPFQFLEGMRKGRLLKIHRLLMEVLSRIWALAHWRSCGCSADSWHTNTSATRKLNITANG